MRAGANCVSVRLCAAAWDNTEQHRQQQHQLRLLLLLLLLLLPQLLLLQLPQTQSTATFGQSWPLLVNGRLPYFKPISVSLHRPSPFRLLNAGCLF